MKKKRKKDRASARPCVELSPSLLSNTVYQRIEVTYQTGLQSVYVSRALCILVLRRGGSDLSVILRGLKKGKKK